MSAETPDYVRVNRDAWTKPNARYADGRAADAWAQAEITWGVWRTPESLVNVLPDVRGKDVVELGCGTGYVGAWLKRRGARRVVGVDITPAQLATAQRLDRKTSLGLQLVEANAEVVPLRDRSFDLVVSEYGASIWCDPYRWIPEAARLLRSGGELAFMRNSTVSLLCMPDTGKVSETLQRPQRGMNRLEWADDDPGVEFHLGAGDLIRLLRANGFEILDLVELFAPEGATDHAEYSYVPADWARRWPSEEIWRARKRD
ncbi:MAG TPA: class I SAM-dependent methyltransferase [Candidatus Limnocylindria bacterium]|nr:class I SAM-dependent methyltransferase [Candidatus Limnocylindria bacterium]